MNYNYVSKNFHFDTSNPLYRVLKQVIFTGETTHIQK